MKGIDKIILGVGVLALIGALAWFFVGGSSSPEAKNIGMDTVAFETIEPGQSPVVMSDWLDPEPQARHDDPNAIFQVFTPPGIYYKTGVDGQPGKFTFKQPKPPREYPDFGIELLAIERVPHRIQYNGHVKTGEDAYLIILKNVVTGGTLRGRVGKTFDDAADQITITDYTVEREMINGVLEEEITFSFRDERDGQEYAANGKDTLYTADYTIFMQTTVSPERTFEWKAVGETFSFTPSNSEEADPKATYTLIDFSLENNAVQVEKSAAYLEDEDVPAIEKVRTLLAQGKPSEAELEETETTTQPDNNSEVQFDNLF